MTTRSGPPIPDSSLPPPPPMPAGLVAAGESPGFDPFAAPPAPPSAPLAKPEIKTATDKQAVEISEENNPSESIQQAFERMLRERGPRVAVDSLTRKLEVAPIPGYHLHWFLERNIPAAWNAWYEYVTPKEAKIKDHSIGGRTAGTTSDDLGGAQISVIGGTNEQGRPEQLVLMKIRKEWYMEAQKKLTARNLSIVQQIFSKKMAIRAPDEKNDDYEKRYTREAIIDMTNGRFRQAK